MASLWGVGSLGNHDLHSLWIDSNTRRWIQAEGQDSFESDQNRFEQIGSRAIDFNDHGDAHVPGAASSVAGFCFDEAPVVDADKRLSLSWR